MGPLGKLKQISVNKISPNPENPRIIFRQEELDSLLISIKKYGVQVPITVFEDNGDYVLIDGERRWRTCKKLNLEKIPAIIQSKPSPLQNLLMMFNIHSLREQWDLFTISNKITKVIDLLKDEWGRSPNETELSEETGLNRGTIRRCKLLIDLPQRFKEIILKELERPKSKQRLTEDFFIEMEQALKTVKNNLPEVIDNIDRIRDVLIKKYDTNIIKNIVDFRKIAKIATSPKNVDFNYVDARDALTIIFKDNSNGIEEIYNSTVSVLYEEKKLLSNFNNVLYYIKHLSEEEKRDQDIIETLLNIKLAIESILNEDEDE